MAEYAVRVRGLTVGYDGKAVVKDMASSGGTGIPVYRALQRAGVPFGNGAILQRLLNFRLQFQQTKRVGNGRLGFAAIRR